MPQIHYRWRPARAWLGVLVYSLVSLGGAAVAGRGIPTHAGAPPPDRLFAAVSGPGPTWIIFTMLLAAVLCMITERGLWGLWKRIGFVFFAWWGGGLLVIPIVLLLVAISAFVPVPRGLIIPMFFSTLAMVVLGMRKSRWFVVPKSPPVAAAPCSPS